MASAAEFAELAAYKSRVIQLEKLLADHDDRDREVLLKRDRDAEAERVGLLEERTKALTADRLARAAEAQEAARVSAWKSTLITQAGEQGLSPNVIFSDD